MRIGENEILQNILYYLFYSFLDTSDGMQLNF